MRFSSCVLLSCFAFFSLTDLGSGFLFPATGKDSRPSSFLPMSTPNFNPDEYAKSMSAAAVEQMKNLKPGDIDKMIAELDNMGPLQKSALKAMNMDPEMMKKTMQMMRDNPSLVANAQKVMETMTPDELLEQSRKAQEQLSKMSVKDLEAANNLMKSIPEDQVKSVVENIKAQKGEDGVIEAVKVDEEESEEKKEIYTGPGSSSDSLVIDAMFKVAEFMSEPPNTGGVTFAGFASLPVIQLLSGDREFDLSPRELKECWAGGSLGATRVDRVGFERVWKEVQEYFEEDIMSEARKEAAKRAGPKRRGASKPIGSTTGTTTIGENLSPEELQAVNERVKTLSNNEVDTVLEMMEKMDPSQEARLKSMGVDPSLMQQTAKMLKENPQMREQAKKMMENMTPDEMLKASQQAQQQMAGMSKADVERALDQLQNPPKQ